MCFFDLGFTSLFIMFFVMCFGDLFKVMLRLACSTVGVYYFLAVSDMLLLS
jgi:hypothetical protein